MISLRRAQARDAELLLSWRNDAVTRRFAFNSGEVSPAEHAAWLERRLADSGCVLWIAEDDGMAVGQVRLDRDGDAAEVSITTAPEARGRGHAVAMLQLAAAQAADELAVERLVARIKQGNEASLRAFRRAGFSEEGDAADGVLRLERRSATR